MHLRPVWNNHTGQLLDRQTGSISNQQGISPSSFMTHFVCERQRSPLISPSSGLCVSALQRLAATTTAAHFDCCCYFLESLRPYCHAHRPVPAKMTGNLFTPSTNNWKYHTKSQKKRLCVVVPFGCWIKDPHFCLSWKTWLKRPSEACKHFRKEGVWVTEL